MKNFFKGSLKILALAGAVWLIGFIPVGNSTLAARTDHFLTEPVTALHLAILFVAIIYVVGKVGDSILERISGGTYEILTALSEMEKAQTAGQR